MISYPQDDCWVVKKGNRYLTVNGWGDWFFSNSGAVFPDKSTAKEYSERYGGEPIRTD